MGLRDVLVRIRGEEDVSKAASRAGTSLQSLGRQAKSLLENQLVQGIGFAGLVTGLGKAVEASDELEASTRKLEATARITGTSLDALRQVAQNGRDTYKLSATLANDFAVELGKLATKAGDVGKASPGLQAFLDIGAARGLGAADTLQAVRQAILGIDEGTDKLFNKNPSAIYAEYATQIGISAGKLDDQQKAQALLNEALEDGEKVRGEYLKFLETARGQQEQLRLELEASAAELGRSLTPALLAVLPALSTLARGLGAFVGGVQLMAVDAAYYFEQIPNTVVLIKGKTLEQLGLLLKAAGDFLPFFGDKVSALGDQLVKEGQRQIKQSKDYSKILLEVKEEQELAIVGVVKASGKAQVQEQTGAAKTITSMSADELAKRARTEEKHAADLKRERDRWNKESVQQLEALGKAFGKVQEQQAKDADESAKLLAEKLGVSLGKASAESIDLTTEAMGRLLEKLKGKIPVEDWEKLNTKLQEHKTKLGDLLPPADELKESAKAAADENKRMSEEVRDAKPRIEEAVEKAGLLARAFLDAATSSGVIDEKMHSVLSSAINIGAALPKAIAGDASSIVAVVSGLAAVITGLKDNPAEKLRREVLMKNSDAIGRLTREIGNFNLGTTGRAFAGLSEVFGGFEGRAAELSKGSVSQRQVGALILQRDLLKALAAKGLSQKDAEDLFSQLGAPELSKIFTTKDSSLILQLIPQILQALNATEFGQFGNDFEGQLQALTEGFNILGVEDDDEKLRQFAELAGKFSPALKDALNVDLSTAEGRAAATKNLQFLFQKLKTGGLSASEIGVSGPQLLTLLNSILPLLATADGLVPGLPLSTTDGAGSGAGGPPVGAPGLPLTTFGLGAPSITGSIVPAPNTTTINGGFNVTVNIDGARDAGLVADEVLAVIDQYLGSRYDNLTAASGALAQVGR